MPSKNPDKEGSATYSQESYYITCNNQSRETANIHDLPYFHPDVVDSDKVREVLKDRSEGSFIIRKSCGLPNNLTISVKHRDGQLIHLRIDRRSGMYAIGDKKFNDIPSLVKSFETKPIVNAENIPGVFLKTPVRRAGFIKYGEDMYCGYANEKSAGCRDTIFPLSSSQFSQDHYVNSICTTPGCCTRPRNSHSTSSDSGSSTQSPSGDGNVKLAEIIDLNNGWRIINVPGQSPEYLAPPTRQVFTCLPEQVKEAMSPEIRGFINNLEVPSPSVSPDPKGPGTSSYMDMNQSSKKN